MDGPDGVHGGKAVSRGGRPAGVLRRMNVEWAALTADASLRAPCGRWAEASSALSGCTGLQDVLERVAVAPDAVLGFLLGRCAAGEGLAGRVVLQALLPKAVRMGAVDPVADVDDYLAALWCEIAAYPLERRPSSVAANLALDTRKAVRRERRPAVDVSTPPGLVEVAADRHPSRVVGFRDRRTGPSVAAVLERAARHRLVDARTSDLLRTVYVDGLPGASAAVRHGLSPGAVRVRCSRALSMLARHADLLAEPA